MADSAACEPMILSLDIGTSACKGALIDRDGRRLSSVREAFAEPSGAMEGHAEQCPYELWEKVARIIHALAASVRSAEIVAISISSQMGSHLLVDELGGPLTKFISWMDSRAQEESRELSGMFTEEERFCEFGARLQIVPSWPLPRLKWWRRHQPEVLDRARYFVQPKDWIIWNLCGRWISDLSSLRGLRHQESGEMSLRLVEWAGFDPSLILPVAPPDSVAGSLSSDLSVRLSLPADIPVLVGWNDLAAATLGATGFPDTSIGVNVTGTSEHLGVLSTRTELDYNPKTFSEIPLLPGQVLSYGVTSSSGRTLSWYWSSFRGRAENPAEYAALESEISEVPAGSNGLICLPCLNGERAPWSDPLARGVFYGITPHHRPAHFSRSVLEGIVFTIKSIQDRLPGPPDSFRVVGGGSAMDVWNQIKADVLQTPIVTLDESEAGCLGAAMLAARAVGWYDSLREAGRAMIRVRRVYEPQAVMTDRYAEAHQRFERIYRALAPIFSNT